MEDSKKIFVELPKTLLDKIEKEQALTGNKPNSIIRNLIAKHL